MKKGSRSRAIQRKDYAPYPWTLDEARFRFEIGEEATRVKSEIQFQRNPEADTASDIALDGQDMELVWAGCL
jgi:aminopeptidase N